MNSLIYIHHEYLNYCKEQKGLSAHTLRAYTQDLASYRRWVSCLDHKPENNEQALIGFHRFLNTETESSPSTRRRRIVTLKAFMKWHSKSERGAADDFSQIDIDLRVPRRLPRPVDREVLTELLASSPHIVPRCPETVNCRKPADLRQTTGLAVRLLVVTGLRIGELTSLRIKDVAGKGGRLRVRGKGNRERVVYVTNQQLSWSRNVGQRGGWVKVYSAV